MAHFRIKNRSFFVLDLFGWNWKSGLKPEKSYGHLSSLFNTALSG